MRAPWEPPHAGRPNWQVAETAELVLLGYPCFNRVMDDENKPAVSPTHPLFQDPPELFQFPIQLLEQWVAIPASDRIAAPLTRQDIDHLIFGLLRSAEAQTKLENMVVAWSNNNTSTANQALLEFRRLNADSQNNFRQFFYRIYDLGSARAVKCQMRGFRNTKKRP